VLHSPFPWGIPACAALTSAIHIGCRDFEQLPERANKRHPAILPKKGQRVLENGRGVVAPVIRAHAARFVIAASAKKRCAKLAFGVKFSQLVRVIDQVAAMGRGGEGLANHVDILGHASALPSGDLLHNA
jgi:hypothetical protein